MVKNKSEILRMLTDLGLNEYESKVYLALVEGGVMTAPQASKLARVPIQRVYDILERLVEKGMVFMVPGKVKRFGPAAPDTGIESYIQKERLHLENAIKKRETMAKSLIQELSYLYNPEAMKSDILDYIKLAKDPSYVGFIFKQAQQKAQRSVWGFMRPPYSVSPGENVEDQLAASRRGVSYRGIYQLDAVDESFAFFIKLGMAAGEEVRFADRVPIKAAIFDERLVFFGLQDPMRKSYTYFFIEHPDMAVAMSEAFMNLWQRSKTPEEVFGEGVWDEVKKIKSEIKEGKSGSKGSG